MSWPFKILLEIKIRVVFHNLQDKEYGRRRLKKIHNIIA